MSDDRMDKIKWDEPPPVDRPRYIPVLSPKPGAPATAIIVSKELVGVRTHFQNQRTRPCLGPENGCEGCKAGLARRWKGYLGAWYPRVGRLVLVELTTQAACDNNPLLADKTRSLRGLEVRLVRRGKARNSPVTAEFVPTKLKDEEIPAEFNVKVALLRMWERMPTDKNDDLEDDGPELVDEIPA